MEKKMSKEKHPVLVIETKDYRIVPIVMEMIGKTADKSIDLREVELFIRTHIITRDLKLWMLFDGTDFKGFLLAYSVFPFVKPEVFIAWCYVDPHFSEHTDKLMKAVEYWTRQSGITKISATVRENLKAFEKKWGFKLDSHTVVKELKYEAKPKEAIKA